MSRQPVDVKEIEKAQAKLLPCPWCKVPPVIVVTDEEGNWKGYVTEDSALEYMSDPWSGVSFCLTHSTKECPIQTYEEELLPYRYWTLDDLVEDWNSYDKKENENG